VARAAALVAVGLVATVTFAGHPTTGRWQTLAIPADLVHVLAMSVWLGGLVIVLAVVLPFAVDPDAAEAVQRFSRLATGAVVALVLTGAFQSWRQVGHLSALNTDYGRALTWKLRIVVVMVAAAALSRTAVRQWLDRTRRDDDLPDGPLGAMADDHLDGDHDTPAASRAAATHLRQEVAADANPSSRTSTLVVDQAEQSAPLEADGGLRRRLRATVLVEVVLAIAVLAVTAALVTTRPAYEAAGGPVSVTMVDRDTVTTLTLDPARAGANELHVYVNTAGGSLNQVQSLTVEASLPARGIGPLPIAVDRSGPNHFTAAAAELPIAGRWQITVRARISEFDERSFTTTVTVH
jgi:copper transport protein